MFVFMFITAILGSAFSIWGYRHSKKRENEGLDVLVSSKGEIPPMIAFIALAIVSFLWMIGVFPK